MVPHLLAFAGYAGWRAGQLEAEIQRGGWLPGPCLAELLFLTQPDQVWRKAYEEMGTSPIAFTTRTVGSA